MSCSQLEEVLSPTASPGALAHAKRCEECGPARAAWDAMGRSSPQPGPSLEPARAAALKELTSVPVARRWWLDALGLSGVNVAVALTAGGLMRWNQSQHASALGAWGIGAGLLAVSVLGAWSALRPGSRRGRLATVGLAIGVALAAGLGGSGTGPEAGARCAAFEVGLALAPLAIALWATSAFAFDATRAAVAGASAAATGLLVLHLHCPNGTAAHLGGFHVLPAVAVAAVLVLARRMVPSRSHAP
jgi:hypothetical protein